MTARKPKVRRRRAGAGRPPLAPGDARTIKRAVLLLPSEAAAHDAARRETPWAEWIREAAELAITRGSTR